MVTDPTQRALRIEQYKRQLAATRDRLRDVKRAIKTYDSNPIVRPHGTKTFLKARQQSFERQITMLVAELLK